MLDGPDLAALREKAEKADGYHVLVHPDVLLAVLSLVDDLRAENERLREALGLIEAEAGGTERWYRTRASLAGSPAANEEQQ